MPHTPAFRPGKTPCCTRFNADNNIPITLTIYMIFTVALICFSAWFNPVVFTFAVNRGVSSGLATTIATAVCSCIQFFIYFPVDKLLMRQKKKEND